MTDNSFEGVIGRTFAESTPHFPPPEVPPNSPNIVMILLDDLGFSDFGCFGSEIDTPSANRLAAEGVRYTNFHVTPVCSPTRACVLTGRNHHTAGMGAVPNFQMGYPGYKGSVPKSTALIGEMLQEQGYVTMGLGKWHLTPMSQFTAAGPYDEWPVQRGFDRYYGTPDGGTSQWRPDLIEDNHWIETPDREGYHFSVDLVDKGIEMIHELRNADQDRPFFCYLAFCAPHFPHHVSTEYIDKYVPVFEKGWDQTRADRLARQIEMGVVEPGTELPPRNPGVKGWDEYDDEAKEAMVRLQATYAGMVDHTDEQIGRLIATLEETGDLDNTIFLLFSDNGASQEGGEVGSLDSMRFFSTGFPDPAAEIAEIRANMDTIGGPRWANNYGIGWSMASNTPLKRWKQDTHGGGVRSSLIVRYPGEIADAGGFRRQFHHAVDLVPTLLDLVGMDVPEQIKGVVQEPLAGESMRYTFASVDSPTIRHTQFFEMNGQRAIWHKGWKAVTHHEPELAPILTLFGDAAAVTDFAADQWELYHLDEDWNEVHDLADQEPDRLAAMIELWWAEAERNNALPLGASINGMNGPPSFARRRRKKKPS